MDNKGVKKVCVECGKEFMSTVDTKLYCRKQCMWRVKVRRYRAKKAKNKVYEGLSYGCGCQKTDRQLCEAHGRY